MVFSTSKIKQALVFICLIGTSLSAHDWVNHIQERLSDAQIRRDVQAMHAAGKTVQQTIEAELRAQHAKVLERIRKQLKVSDQVWQETEQEIAEWRQAIRHTLYSKENIHDFDWATTQQEINEQWQDPEDRKLRNNIRIIIKNTLIDYGINPKNIIIRPQDDNTLSYYKDRIEQEQSWWQRQVLRFRRGMYSWWRSFSPLACRVGGIVDAPICTIEYNVSSLAYFEPVELRAMMGHEITHLLEGHHKEQELFGQLSIWYQGSRAKIRKKTWREFYHIHELIADQLPALNSFVDAQKGADAMYNLALKWPVTTLCITPLVDYFLPRFSTHPWTIYRRRSLKNIMRYLEVEQTLTPNASSTAVELS